jgi:hypothetical protein
MAGRLDRLRRPQLDQDTLLALWQDGVPLRYAWEVFADEWSAARFRELQRTDSHLAFQRSLQTGFLARLYASEHQTIGVEHGSDARRILIDQCYFSETAEVDWKKSIVVALGKIFYEVRVQWQREPPDKTRPIRTALWIHPRELEAQWELGPPCGPEPFPGEQWQLEELDETLLNEPRLSSEPSGFAVQSKREPPRDTTRSEPTPSQKRKPGRHKVIPLVREVVRELKDRKEFVGLNTIEIEAVVRRKAKERFPKSFPHPTQPCAITILRALKEEDWEEGCAPPF